MKKILFVCTGNTCRSPMAHAIFNHLADPNKFIANSCGIYADGFSQISSNAKAVLSENKIEFEHTSKKVSSNLMQEADMIICMTDSHNKLLSSMYLEFSHKILTMPKDILDPFGGSIDIYRECYSEIYNCVLTILNHLKKQND